jgi:hypothetical protein
VDAKSDGACPGHDAAVAGVEKGGLSVGRKIERQTP